MKKFFTLAFLTVGIFTNAQTFTLTPGNTDTVDAPLNTLTIFDIYPNNITASPILFKWTKVSVSLPVGWDYALCDYGHCYTGIPANGTMDTVDAGDPGLLGLNINPYSVIGQGIVRLYVYDAAFPSDGDTVTWVVNAGTVSVNEASRSWDAVSVYPNPASSVVSLSNIPGSCMIVLTDIAGKIIAKQTVNGGNVSFDVLTLKQGLYTITITENGQIISHKKFIVGR
ncbi:MAG TPA: T9SS type A sorting domain-containing protein [Flavobacteriales bacterium]|nr:T9SS type A sorting domain-containing protein [Flavobacteriales bacterium]